MIQTMSTYDTSVILQRLHFELYELPKSHEFYKEENKESSVYLLPQVLIDNLEEKYIFINPEEIKAFLLSNIDLIDILIDAPEHIRRIFGEVPIYLKLTHDPEENWDELFIVIKTSYSPEKAVEFENKLFDEWFINVIDKVNTRLSFTEEPL